MATKPSDCVEYSSRDRLPHVHRLGENFTQFYNDGYRPILGSTKHPAAMGISTRQTFAEIWHIIGPMFEGVMRGTPVTLNDFHLPLDRHGFVEECYFVFSYSPIREESGNVGGVLVTVTETTERVLSARRLKTFQDPAAQTQGATSVAAVYSIIAAVLGQNADDLPLTRLYSRAPDGSVVLLATSGELLDGTVDVAQISPEVVDSVFELGSPRLIDAAKPDDQGAQAVGERGAGGVDHRNLFGPRS